MRKPIYVFISVLVMSLSLNAQTFQTYLIAESAGQIDTVYIGYDLDASIEVDKQFGEVDLFTTPFGDDFEVRLGQINLNYLECSGSFYSDEDIVTYMSEIDILPRDCEYYDYTQTINNLDPYSTIFIRYDDLPVTLRWDKTTFDNECLEGSLFTDWHPGGWFDVVGCGENIDPLFLFEHDSLVIDNTTDQFISDFYGDSLTMVYIGLGPVGSILNTQEVDQNPPMIYPNPSTGMVRIEHSSSLIQDVEIYTTLGQRIYATTLNTYQVELDLSEYDRGTYIIRLQTNDKNIYYQKVVLID